MEPKGAWLPVIGTFVIPAIFIACWLAYRWVRKWTQLVSSLENLPGAKPNIFCGNLLDIWGPRSEIFTRIVAYMEKYAHKSLGTLYLGPMDPHILLMRAEAVEVLLTNTRNLDKAPFYGYLHSWLGRGLLTSTGSKWHARRKIITPSFHFKILDNFTEVFNEQAQIFSSKLERHADDGKPFKVDPLVSLCTLDIICETAMQKKLNAQNNSESSYVRAVHDSLDIIFKRFLQPWYRSEWVFAMSPPGRRLARNLKTMHAFTSKVIAERRQSQQSSESKSGSGSSVEQSSADDVYGQKKRRAFLDMLLEYSDNGQGLSDEDIREEVDTFMFEGHDTTSSGISWTIYLLGLHDTIQERVVDELRSVLGDSDRPLTSADLKELRYLECVVKESLRLFPPVSVYSRHLREDTQIGDYLVPKGVTLGTHAFLLHRDPKYFPNPEVFDPDRFLPENSSQRSPYAYVPFSAGPRNCIGQKFALMEEKCVLAHILRRYRITSMEKREEIKVTFEIILRPANGTWIKLEKRNAHACT